MLGRWMIHNIASEELRAMIHKAQDPDDGASVTYLVIVQQTL